MTMRMIKGKKEGGLMAEGPSKDVLYYPHFGMDLEYLPEAKSWKIGKTYKITLKVRQTGMDMHKGKDGKESGHANFDVIGIEPNGETKDKPMRYTE